MTQPKNYSLTCYSGPTLDLGIKEEHSIFEHVFKGFYGGHRGNYPMKQLPTLLMLIFLVGIFTTSLEAIGQSGITAEDACKKALRADKWLEKKPNQTVCYQAVIEGSAYARKMLHRSSFLVDPVLRLYLDVAIAASTLDLDLGSADRKRLQRQQVRFWKKSKNADLDLLFLEDNSRFPYRFSKVTQKKDRAEIIVHFQRRLSTDTEPTRSNITAGRYLLSRPNKTWLIDDFEPVDMKLDINQIGIWLGDYINYARSAYGNDIDPNFIALASEAGLSHFWLSGEPGQDADFLRRNHGRDWGSVPPLINSPVADSDPGVFIDLGFFKNTAAVPGSVLEDDPAERSRYQVVRRNDRWFIASFKEIGATQSEVPSKDEWVFENSASVTKYLSQSRTLSRNLKACEPSELTLSIPTVPHKKIQLIIQGYQSTLCQFKVMILGAIGLLCKAPAEAIEAQLAMERSWSEQLQAQRDGPFPLRLTPDKQLAERTGQAMSKSCEVTIDEQPPLEIEKYVSNTLRYIENLVSCAPSTYTYTHPMIPGFTGKNVIKGDDQGRCLLQIHMPGDIIMQCAASARHIELLRNQTALMLKELQETGAYQFSIEIDLGSGVSSSELSNLMGEECRW